jgi:hypothetical protein
MSYAQPTTKVASLLWEVILIIVPEELVPTKFDIF